MKSYGIRFITAVVIIVCALVVLFRFYSDDTPNYEGGTLVKADEDSIYAFSVVQEDKSNNHEAVHAYAKTPESVINIEKKSFDQDIVAFINSDSDNLVYVRKPEI